MRFDSIPSGNIYHGYPVYPHHAGSQRHVCDRVLIIRHGELALDSTLEALKQSNRLKLQSSAAWKKSSMRLNSIRD